LCRSTVVIYYIMECCFNHISWFLIPQICRSNNGSRIKRRWLKITRVGGGYHRCAGEVTSTTGQGRHKAAAAVVPRMGMALRPTPYSCCGSRPWHPERAGLAAGSLKRKKDHRRTLQSANHAAAHVFRIWRPANQTWLEAGCGSLQAAQDAACYRDKRIAACYWSCCRSLERKMLRYLLQPTEQVRAKSAMRTAESYRTFSCENRRIRLKLAMASARCLYYTV